jgi:hypothetical protein
MTNDQTPIPVRQPRSVNDLRSGPRLGLDRPITADAADDPLGFDGRPGPDTAERDLPPVTEADRRAAEHITPNGTAPKKPAPTFTIHAILDDFPLDISFSGTADHLKATVARLREIGAVPPTPAARQAIAEEKAREAPVCQYHGPMKESTKAPGAYFCTKKMGDGSYCKERWPK